MGFFFSSDVVEGLTSVFIPIENEKEFRTIKDFVDNGITLHLIDDPHKTKRYCTNVKIEYNSILDSNVSYCVKETVARDDFFRVEKLANTSISVSDSPYSSGKVDQTTIKLGGKIVYRRTSIYETMYELTYPLMVFSPFYERLSHLYWRFQEIGLDNLWPVKRHYNLPSLSNDKDLEPLIHADEEWKCAFETSQIQVSLYVFSIGNGLALLALTVELILHLQFKI